jgi:outer membrane protein assembly factor BamD (BamD/ComL family)
LPAPSATQASSSEPAPSASSPNLGLEIAQVDRARRALAEGNAGEAQRLLDEYQHEFPRGRLGQEAVALRVEALLKQGNRGAATALAAPFLAAYPASPAAARVRALLGTRDDPNR